MFVKINSSNKHCLVNNCQVHCAIIYILNSTPWRDLINVILPSITGLRKTYTHHSLLILSFSSTALLSVITMETTPMPSVFSLIENDLIDQLKLLITTTPSVLEQLSQQHQLHHHYAQLHTHHFTHMTIYHRCSIHVNWGNQLI